MAHPQIGQSKMHGLMLAAADPLRESSSQGGVHLWEMNAERGKGKGRGESMVAAAKSTRCLETRRRNWFDEVELSRSRSESGGFGNERATSYNT